MSEIDQLKRAAKLLRQKLQIIQEGVYKKKVDLKARYTLNLIDADAAEMLYDLLEAIDQLQD